MEMTELQQLAQSIIHWGVLLLAFLIGCGILVLLVMYLVDKTQTRQTIRRNYPVVGRLRYQYYHARQGVAVWSCSCREKREGGGLCQVRGPQRGHHCPFLWRA